MTVWTDEDRDEPLSPLAGMLLVAGTVGAAWVVALMLAVVSNGSAARAIAEVMR